MVGPAQKRHPTQPVLMNSATIETVRLLPEAIPVGRVNATSSATTRKQPGSQFVDRVACSSPKSRDMDSILRRLSPKSLLSSKSLKTHVPYDSRV